MGRAAGMKQAPLGAIAQETGIQTRGGFVRTSVPLDVDVGVRPDADRPVGILGDKGRLKLTKQPEVFTEVVVGVDLGPDLEGLLRPEVTTGNGRPTRSHRTN